MKDLTDPWWMKFKAVLFIVTGVFSAVLLLRDVPTWHDALFLGICVWSFCRLYYFAFYVIERYIDPEFRFSGLGSVVRYLLKREKRDR